MNKVYVRSSPEKTSGVAITFTTKQLAYGNCTETSEQWHRLDQTILQYVQKYINTLPFFIAPFTVTIKDRFLDSDEGTRWKTILSTINSKGRNLRGRCNLNGKNKDATQDQSKHI